jgi:hypothetical protein
MDQQCIRHYICVLVKRMALKKLQIITYLLGFLLIGVSYIEFSYGTYLQNRILIYDAKVTHAEVLREDLRKIHFDYFDAAAQYYETDFDCYASVYALLMNSSEAIVKLWANAFNFIEAFQKFESEFLNNYNDPNADLKWIFTERLIGISWLANNDTSITNFLTTNYGITDISEWNKLLFTDSVELFLFPVAYEILQAQLADLPFMVNVHFWKFDDYVNVQFLNPLIDAQNAYKDLRSMIGLTTIGILVLGFIINYSSAPKFWKIIFLILAFVCVFFI